MGAIFTAPTLAASPTNSSCADAASGCAHAPTVAHVSDSEGEEAEEEELEEGAEEAATAEVEAEEAETATGNSATNGSSGADSVVLSHLQLTAKATAALAHHLPVASVVSFSFTLSAPAKVQVRIVRQSSTAGHRDWTTLPDSLTLSTAEGHTALSLKGHNRLSAGRYRLTVKPTGGLSRSIYLSVRR